MLRDALELNEYYQPQPRRDKRENPKETRVEFPHFYGKENVKAYLEWKTKVDQTFEKLQLDEFSRFSMATLSFQEYARSWWTKRETDVRIGRKSEVVNCDELKMCMRRKFVLPSYVKKKKLREEMKELVEKGRNFINGEKEYVRREKEFREKLQALKERKINERREREKKELKENPLSGVELDIDINSSSIENPCENMLEEKSMFGVEPDIDINLSSIEKPCEGLFEKEEEEFRKNEEYLTTPSTSIVKKQSLKKDCNTLNSHFPLNHNAYSYSKKSQKKTLCDVVCRVFFLLLSLEKMYKVVRKFWALYFGPK